MPWPETQQALRRAVSLFPPGKLLNRDSYFELRRIHGQDLPPFGDLLRAQTPEPLPLRTSEAPESLEAAAGDAARTPGDTDTSPEDTAVSPSPSPLP